MAAFELPPSDLDFNSWPFKFCVVLNIILFIILKLVGELSMIARITRVLSKNNQSTVSIRII